MNAALKILLVDDDEEDHLITRALLRRAFPGGVDLDWVCSWEDAARAIHDGDYDVCLVDYRLGERTGVDLVHEATSARAMAPIIMLTGADSREVDLAAQAAGAYDYLVKSELSAPLLDRAIRYAIERNRVERQLADLAHFDPLTGLVNRSCFLRELEAGIRAGQRGPMQLAVLLLDLDRFKDVNDTLGHPAGDALLKEVANRLNALLRGSDTAARLGGDEFAIVATQLGNAGDARLLAERVLASFREPVLVEGHEIRVTTSIGITVCPDDGEDLDQILRNADLALYKAKKAGRDHYQFYGHALNAEARTRQTKAAELRAALDDATLRLHYQPRVDLASRLVVGLEVSASWPRADGSWTAPGDFLSAAESSGLIAPLGEQLLRGACRQKLAWDRAGTGRGPITLNLYAVQVRRDAFFDRLMRIIEQSGVDPGGIEFAVSERAVMDVGESLGGRLRLLHDKGIRLAIDDFGSGSSSLSLLKRLPLDALRVAPDVVAALETDPDAAAVAAACIRVAGSFQLTAVAKGVATAAQAHLLQGLGCTLAQGPLFGGALVAQDLECWLDPRTAGWPRAAAS